jgi:CoA:oxalate CoA-transferase
VKAGAFPDDSAPLAGMTITGGGQGRVPGLRRAERLLLEHLELLGARRNPARSSSPRPSGALFALHGEGVELECALSGWPGPGNGLFDESVAQAASGVMAVHGRASGGPRRLGVDYVSVMTGVLGAQGVLAAVLGRLRGIPVGSVDVAALEAAVFSLVQYVAHATAEEDPDVLRPAELTDRHRPPFVSSDGVRFELETLDSGPWAEFWTALGAPPKSVARSWLLFLSRYGRATAPLPVELFEAVVKTRFATIRELVTRTAGMSLCRVRSLAERRADPDLWPATGTAAPWRILPLGTPHTGPLPPAGTRDATLPLAGIRVLESTRRMQGPLASRMLQLLGAEVTRIEPPGGDPMRGLTPMAFGCAASFRAANEGKRVVEIDFRTPAGRDEVLDLVRDTDVFLHNWAPGKASALGLDARDMARVNPGVVYAYASGWGDALGPVPPLGTDFQVQAHSGVADRITAAEDLSPRPTLMIITDVLGAAVSAETMVAGLLRRHRTGHGVQVESSLFSAATTMLTDELRAATPPVPAGIDQVFRTADGLLAVAARTRETTARLANAVGAAPDDDLTEHLARVLRTRTATEWETALHALAVPAAVVVEDVSTLPARFGSMFEYHGCSVVTAPWRFR